MSDIANLQSGWQRLNRILIEVKKLCDFNFNQNCWKYSAYYQNMIIGYLLFYKRWNEKWFWVRDSQVIGNGENDIIERHCKLS